MTEAADDRAKQEGLTVQAWIAGAIEAALRQADNLINK
jgi:hypothetical protein